MVRDEHTHHVKLSDKEMTRAGAESMRGALAGGTKWAFIGGACAVAAWRFSPVYRGLTIQFKVFLQMSFMTFGSIVGAEKRLRQHELDVRREKKFKRDAEVWRRFEVDFEESGTSEASEKRSFRRSEDQ
ncbi:hypothetical protein EJ05DRAFT_83370 [Pseudovirgaria hyperparasitica]|uniref:HIG1 domain-containing protein n=1 Tax=Pseudovirgaria hyperparasitica TaxID=470096 RepID=A0A6A6VZ41_9PEZI|nr:uncharacterized protein EJ05DRAFT_83370 [Pseudovirgaria hyperparasitica]KAF2755948.1 hypothetical protein EJ05DRAFT_83370 [Pseudovirgaria hyperparasitica]